MGWDQIQVSKHHLLLILLTIQCCVDMEQIWAHPQSPRRMTGPQCPMCSCILKQDVFKWANSYTDNSLTGPVVLMEILAHGRGCFSSCGSVTDRCQVTTKGMWGKRLGNKSQCLLVWYKPRATPGTFPDCWEVHPERQEDNWNHILSLNGRNKMTASLTRTGDDRNYIGTLFPYDCIYQFFYSFFFFNIPNIFTSKHHLFLMLCFSLFLPAVAATRSCKSPDRTK